MIKNFVETLERADEDNDVRCIVITGAGKHFCAGGDVKDMQNKSKECLLVSLMSLAKGYKEVFKKFL